MSMREEALALAKRGFEVFPLWHAVDDVCACGDAKRGAIAKHPRCWRGHLDATTDEATIRTWWGDTEYVAHAGFEWEVSALSNIGIAIADGVLVVDVDPRNRGDATFDLLTESAGFPDTLTTHTGSGGLHLWYRVPAGMQYPKTLNEHGGPGIDLKQKGGYTVAAPSTHKSGGRYEWADPDQPMVEAPAWLLKLGTPRKARVKRTLDRSKHSDALSPETLADGDAIITLLEPHYVAGSKHAIARSFGGYAKKQGRSSALVEYVISQLPSDDPEMRVDAALTYYGYDNPTGWAELKEHLPAEAAQALEAQVKGRRKAAGLKLSERRLSASAPQELREVATGGNPLDAMTEPDDPAADVPPLDYLCEKFGVAEGKVTIIGGYSGSGKSPLALLLAACIASGKAFLGAPTSRRQVVFFMYEGERLTRIRRKRIAQSMGIVVPTFRELELRRMHQGLDETSLQIMRDAALWYRDTHDGKGVVYFHDTYTSAMRGLDQNSAEYADALWALGDMGDETGAVNIVLAHFKKSKDNDTDIQMVSGHNSITGAAQTILGLLPNKKKQEECTIYPTRMPEIPFAPQTIVWSDEIDPQLPAGAGIIERTKAVKWGLKCETLEAPSKEADPREEIAREIMKALAGKTYGLSTGEICAKVQARDTTVREVLKSLAASGQLKTLKQGASINYVKA